MANAAFVSGEILKSSDDLRTEAPNCCRMREAVTG
jgi:hypothetical protein